MDLNLIKVMGLLDFLVGGSFKNPLDVLRTIIDIGVISYIFYKLVVLARETRAWQLIKGILFIILAVKLSELLGLRIVSFVLNHTIQYIAIALVVLFQPELRRALEQIGRSRFRSILSFDEESLALQTTTAIDEIVKATAEMGKMYIGALIIIERDTKIGDVINSGTQIDSIVAAELLMNIFTPYAPLHDGAVIIRDNKIKAVACFLPLTDNPNLGKELGTRHRAALGITEVSDSLAVIVSGETGKVSLALNGGLTRNLTPDMLRKALSKNLLERDGASKRINLWKILPK